MSSVGNKFGFAVHRLPEGANEFVIPYAKVGVEIECEGVRDVPQSKLLASWDHHVDESLRNNGREFTTKGGLVGKELVKAIRDICQYCTESGYNVGYPRAGIHLHIDMTDMNEENDTELLNCVLSYILFEKAVFGFAGEWREACGFCDALSLSQRDFPHISKLLYDWEKAGPLSDRNFSKYQAINFLPLQKFGTIEFRHLSTTFDPARILEWVNICLSFKNFGKKFNADPVTFLEKKGFKALCQAVFGKALPSIAKYINEKDVNAAIAHARALRVGKKKQAPESWDLPDNPLLKIKEGGKKGFAALEDVVQPARAGQHNRPGNAPVEVRWDAALADAVRVIDEPRGDIVNFGIYNGGAQPALAPAHRRREHGGTIDPHNGLEFFVLSRVGPHMRNAAYFTRGVWKHTEQGWIGGANRWVDMTVYRIDNQ